ncbi:zinc finger protein 624-like isoform X2 [Daktulosphaira vitifoliae]|uniref:zinc finger protein 624-like isoform X2 n=1 Tax=Daktulosphaira vitifoliae TaxID=58002 RepID=UPI0021AAC6E2|nr:zinc finger protein 624-like isoform X2 [Daktulosphaira vitifoliae]
MALRLCAGGSQISFSDDVKCCVPTCGATREGNRTLPFYTFPSNVTLCREWVEEIQLPINDLQNLHRTHMVCSKHFTSFDGGMVLNITNNILEKTSNKNKKCVALKLIKNSALTQTLDYNWLRNLKNTGVELLCSKFIQCRICTSVSVQALNIYSKCNTSLKLETLINKLLPIKVNVNDTKPLYICVECLLKLTQFEDVFERCKKSDKIFKSSFTKENIPIIELSDNSDEESKSYPNQSKLSINSSRASNFIQKESRKHKIKILIPGKNNKVSCVESKKPSNITDKNKIIEIEFLANYIICHGKEWVHEIHVSESQLKYSQNTIDQILEVIKVTMNKQCQNNNSKVVPLTILPSCLERVVLPKNSIRTDPINDDYTNQINDEIRIKAAEILIKRKSMKKGWICKKCGLKLDSRQLLIAHVRFYHPRPCRYCGELITPRDQLYNHEKEHQKPSPDGFICHLCGRHLKTHKSLNLHYKHHKNKEKFCCNTCNLQFINGFGLRKHIRQHHKELLVKKKPEDIQKERQKCTICDLWLSSHLALQVHIKTHLPIEERMKICPKCNKVFINARRFKMHVETHGSCPIKCPECPRSFPTQEHLNNHSTYHKLSDPVCCDICHQFFKTKTTLKSHIARIHQRVQYIQKTFSCIYCKTVYANKEELKNHVNKHTPKEKALAFAGDNYGKVQCNMCNRFFLYKSRLTMHKIYYHSKQCQQCDKLTNDNSVNHYCKPKGSRALQYCCQYCIKRFSSKQRLHIHERTHGLDYRYQCTICNKWFTKMTALKTHSYSHSSEKNYACNVCGKLFNLITAMKKHLKIHQHNENQCFDNLNSDNVLNTIALPITVNLPSSKSTELLNITSPNFLLTTENHNECINVVSDLESHLI